MSGRGFKRARGPGGGAGVGRARRAIDKQLIVVQKSAIVGANQTTLLKTITYPGTVVGLRWSLACKRSAGVAFSRLYWAIVVVHDGNGVNNLGIGDAGDFYTPEQDVLAFGAACATTTAEPAITFNDSTRTMRKLKQGDQLFLAVLGAGVDWWEMNGVVQFFLKT